MALYGLLGDIHGNREALQAVLERLDGMSVSRLLCVGDVIGYNADPDECASRLRQREAVCIAGNHDLIGTGRLGFERCSNKAMHALKRTRRTLMPETAAWVRALPSHARIEDRYLLTHGGVRDVQQYMTQPKHLQENVAYLRADFPGRTVCFYGHTHEQKVYEIEGSAVHEVDLQASGGTVTLRADREYFVNPGSVDASRKRAMKLAQFAVLDTAASSVTFGEVPYDDGVSEEKAREHGYRIEPWRDRLYDIGRRITAFSYSKS
ncbi:MAG TPA: metallophosphoesterase family protein [Usitatibacter sp.]|jgi:predicted phosphodiesterase|nr:metallophosphoesterase family protein [Usitatibacter sp.]